MKVRPLHDRIIVQRLEEGEQKIGGIIIPDTAKEKPQEGEVVAVGSGAIGEAMMTAERGGLRNRRGAIVVMTGVFIVALMLIAAISVDASRPTSAKATSIPSIARTSKPASWK